MLICLYLLLVMYNCLRSSDYISSGTAVRDLFAQCKFGIVYGKRYCIFSPVIFIPFTELVFHANKLLLLLILSIGLPY